MNWKTLGIIAALGFALRAGCSVMTEVYSPFPAFYFTDSRIIESLALEKCTADATGEAFNFIGPQSQLIQIRVYAAIYRLVGQKPFVTKLLNAALGAASCVVLYALFSLMCAPAAACAGAILFAIWPSNVFFTSQNFKEAPTNLLAYLALWAFVALLVGKIRKVHYQILTACGLIAALATVALYRPYILPILVIAMVGAGILNIVQGKRISTTAWLQLLTVLGALLIYKPVSLWFTRGYKQDRSLATHLIPLSWDEQHRPLTPIGLTAFRAMQLKTDKRWAEINAGREISTQIFPDQVFQSWFDIAAFLPKGGLYALFMPLPGLYPLDGKPGRILAAIENVILLVLFCLGIIGAMRERTTPARAVVLLFFVGMAVGSALLEPDLGSAMRHKILFLPLLFPFAVEAINGRLFDYKGPSTAR